MDSMFYVALNMSRLENEFSPADATCLWVNIDPYGELGKFLVNFSEIVRGDSLYGRCIDKDKNIYIDDMIDPQTIINPYIPTFPSVEEHDKQVERFDNLVLSFNMILPQVIRYADKDIGIDFQEPMISRDRLTVLANAMAEKPLFLFPDVKDAEASCLNVENDGQKKQLPDELKAWMLHDSFSIDEATCLAIGVDPSYINSSDDPEYTAISTALKKAIVHDELAATIDGCDLSSIRDPFSHDLTYDQWKKIELLRSDLDRWFYNKGYETAFFYPDKTNRQTTLDTAPIDQTEQAYTTPKMQLVSDAVDRFWQGVNPHDKRAPKNENIEDWLNNEANKRGLQWSQRISESVATIIRHPDKP